MCEPSEYEPQQPESGASLNPPRGQVRPDGASDSNAPARRARPAAPYPHIGEGEILRHVRDRNGVFWRVVRDDGMVTCADQTRIYSAGISWLESNHGPLETVEPVRSPPGSAGAS